MRPRVITPALAFQASLTIARQADGATVTKGEAEKALVQLEGAPDAAHIVSAWLTKHDGELSQRARQVLVDFVQAATKAEGGAPAGADAARAVDVQARATGVKRLEQLVAGRVQREVHLVHDWLDAANSDFQTAKTQLTSLAHDAMSHFGDDVHRLLDLAKAAAGGHVIAMAPRPLRDALSLKYPSDAEDHGSTTMTSQKYPSDNEDSGAATPAGLPKRVSTAHADHIRQAFAKIPLPQWQPGSVVDRRVDERFAHVRLGDALTAFVPTGPLTPTALPGDPNLVKTFYVERHAAGLTESCGPFTL